ncbi:hypothetical protein HPP92_018239 [Vanilla planifolia]|uniref:Altered inheritance of mitochondria protein 32 n=1 Tax=Vanilla planifolia TaxID=51239 RepID=A0A835URC5_VANPL|nr:hypothetical protein HPP92_018239 [Vanilla planifolia]
MLLSSVLSPSLRPKPSSIFSRFAIHRARLFSGMEDALRSSPIAFGGGLSAGEEGFQGADQGSQIGSAAGSLQGEGILSAGGDGGSGSDPEFGFQRPEVGKEVLVGTVQFYERHVFLCYKTPQVWPPHVEAAEFDRLPRLFSAVLAAKKGEMKKRTRLTICEGEDGTESSNGDVLIFPDMIRYRRLTHFDVEHLVEEVLVKETQWLPGAVETLTGSFVFVCAHGTRDRRCGVCGPVLIRKFKEEINSRGLQGQVSVSACSHIGGHKYAGNVIIFSSSASGEVTGHWYGYVTPVDVPLLLDQHIGKGEIVDYLWRGQMGLKEEDQRKFLQQRLQANAETEDITPKYPQQTPEPAPTGGCCQGSAAAACCQNGPSNETSANPRPKSGPEETHNISPQPRNKETKSKTGSRRACKVPTWFESWEREDTYAALAVVAALASVAVAYGCYRQLR